MKAFVKTTNGVFPGVNFYHAWKGFNGLMYDVHTFEDCNSADITRDTPTFGGTHEFARIMEKLNIYYQWDTVPDILSSYYKRTMERTTLGEAKNRFFSNEQPLFVKPVKSKEFVARVWENFTHLIPFGALQDDVKVVMCPPVKFRSEFRTYVYDNKIFAIKHYSGKWNECPDEGFIEEAIQQFSPNAPISYSLDVGKIGNEDAVVEVNDFTSLGNYGLSSNDYAYLTSLRWNQLTH